MTISDTLARSTFLRERGNDVILSSYGVDPTIFHRLCVCNDGQPVPLDGQQEWLPVVGFLTNRRRNPLSVNPRITY